MAVPTLVVEMSLTAGDQPNTPNPAWTDISSDVKSVSIRRGRDDDFDANFRTSATLVLNNHERKYDPFNSSSPYNGRLNPRRQVQIGALIGGNYYPLFRGLVNGFPVVWERAGKESTITVECLDFLSLLAVQKLQGDFADTYTRSLSPVHYYKCNEPSGSTTIKDYGSSGLDLAFTNLVAPQPRPMASYIPLGFGLKHNSINIEEAAFENDRVATATTGNFTMSAWTAGTGAVEQRNLLLIQGSSANADELSVDVSNTTFDSAGNTRIQAWVGRNATTYQYRKSTLDRFNTTIPNHVCVTYDGTSGNPTSGQIKIYVNGVDATDTVGGNFVGLKLFPATRIQFYGGIIQELAVFDKVLTQTEITNLYQFGQGNQQETTSQRMQRLADLTTLHSAFFNVSYTASTTMAGIPDFQSSVLDAMLKTQATEGGYLFCAKDGTITATSRDVTWTSANSLSQQVEIADDGVNPDALEYTDQVQLYIDGDNIRNDVTVNYSFGAPVNAIKQSSIDEYGRHTETIDAQNSTYIEANDLAYHYLNYYSLVVPNLSPIEIGLNATTQSDWEKILGLELLDRYKFKRTPAVGSQYTTDLILNSINFELRPKVWSVKISGSSRFTYRPPTVTSLAFSSLTKDSVTISAQVNANNSSTAVTFEYSTSNTFSSYTSVSATPSTATGTTATNVSANLTGLTAGTTYYYRCKAVNAVGTTYATGSFTTYALKTVRFTGSGTWTKPSVPTGGTTITSTATNAFIISGGGGVTTGSIGGGGGGGTALSSSSITLADSMVVVIGAGGGTAQADGGGSSMTNLGSISGGAQGHTFLSHFDNNGGASANGNAGGTGYLDIFGTYPSAGGGGGGNGGAGANGGVGTGNGGNGGAGGTIYGYTFGSGGGGQGDYTSGANGGGSPSTYGRGTDGDGTYLSTGGYGGFQYYGPAGSRSGTGWTES